MGVSLASTRKAILIVLEIYGIHLSYLLEMLKILFEKFTKHEFRNFEMQGISDLLVEYFLGITLFSKSQYMGSMASTKTKITCHICDISQS